MKKLLQPFCYLFFIALLTGCSKSGQKALEKGNYYDATILAVEKLKRDGDNSKARDVLPEAYRLASTELKNDAERAKSINDAFRWETVLGNYVKLNRLYKDISDCRDCRRLVKPVSYSDEESNSRELAAKERYDFAVNVMKAATMESGRTAYESFEKLNTFAPNYRDSHEKMADALNMGSFHVVVEQPKLNARLYDYSYSYFQDQVDNFLATNRRLNKFVQFYKPIEAEQIKLQPDQIIRLEFIDFVVGQTRVDSKQREVASKDSVKTGTVKIEGKNVDVFGIVKAKVTENKKQVHSSGVMLMQIIDYKSNKRLFSRELAGEFDWFNEWLTYNGDERALTTEQLRAAKNREELPPPPQQLFTEFCKPIYDQFTTQTQNFYRKY